MSKTLAIEANEIAELIKTDIGYFLTGTLEGWYLPNSSTPLLKRGERYHFYFLDEVSGAKPIKKDHNGYTYAPRHEIPFDEALYPLLTAVVSDRPIVVVSGAQIVMTCTRAILTRMALTKIPSTNKTAISLIEVMVCRTIKQLSKESEFTHRNLDHHRLFDEARVRAYLTKVIPNFNERSLEEQVLSNETVNAFITALYDNASVVADEWLMRVVRFVKSAPNTAKFHVMRSGSILQIIEGPSTAEEYWAIWKEAGILDDVVEQANRIMSDKQE